MSISDCSKPAGTSALQLPSALMPFDDIIDGYFPLQVSLAQMMARLGADYALVELSYAPIMRIPGLAHDAPVPLNIREGTAGSIKRMLIEVDLRNPPLRLRGHGAWSWNDTKHAEDVLDPMTRLAEPAYLTGLRHPAPPQQSQPLCLTGTDNTGQAILDHFAWPHAPRPIDPLFARPCLARL